jgi:chromosome segregation protein
MLKLKKIQILGFKSFCDRTEVTLPGEGLAAVVGPNGCGKSNILDAVSWVLGEQSAKSLRGAKMEDVIFAGTRDRKPLGMAEVSLTLIDPDTYGEGPLAKGSGEEKPAEPESPDWDEEQRRQELAAETEEIIADAQPGQALEEESGEPGNEAPAAPADGAVVLKIRRRKFRRTPARAGEITITRRLFRSGESEYLLNGKLCRLRDIQDIFMGTGLGPESYAIIEQERIGQILSSKPFDRRAMIEEAAGITRFKTKKRLAELRLEQAKQNLARVNDIFEEVTRQLGSLKRQAAKAERYAAIREELRAKLRVVLASKLRAMDAEQSALTLEINALNERVEKGAAEVESLDAEHAAEVARGYQLDISAREASARGNQAALDLERAVARHHGNEERIADLRSRAAAGSAELEQARLQLEGLSAERDQHRVFLEQAAAAAAGFREQANSQNMQAREAATAVAQAEQQLESERRLVMQSLAQAGNARRETAQAEEALAALDREAQRLSTEAEAARRDLEALGVERGQASLHFESVTEMLQRLEGEIRGLRADFDSKRREEQETKRRADQLRAERATLTGRRTSLENLIREHSYSTDTVRKIFRARSQGAHREASSLAPVGTLADFLEVEGQYESVVDEYLRDELNFVVVKSWDAAEAGMRLLKTDVDGRATFLVHPSDSQAKFSFAVDESDRVPLTQDGVVRLKNCIRVLDGFGTSLEAILPKLREGYVAPDAETARSLALENPQAFFLAPTGECFHNVTVTGGKPRAEGPLALKRELRETQKKLDAVEAELGQAETAVAALGRGIAELSRMIDAKSEERRLAERESANHSAALRQMEAEVRRLEARLSGWTLETARNQDTRAAKQALIERKRQEAARLEAEHFAAEERQRKLEAELAGRREAREQRQQAAAQAVAELAGLEERKRGAEAAFSRIDRMFSEISRRVAQLEQQIAAAVAEEAQRNAENEELATRRALLSEQREQALKESTAWAEEARLLRVALHEGEQQLKALRGELDALRETRSVRSTRAARLAADLQHLEESCSADLGIPAWELRDSQNLPALEPATLAEEDEACRGLKVKLDAMGPVNMMALEEYKETAERHGFLETQRKDLLDSIENTQSSIREIDLISRQKFEEAFARINENFSATFTRLFSGGQAFMKLTDEENVGESGIDIVASPPGKKLQNVLLLSGGEKALTALSLLVGIFQFQPSPFCVLDEVDAPLDETNVGRLAEMLKGMSAGTQFVLVTHSKRMMTSADLIYGVTMQEPGVSKVVSVRMGGVERGQQRLAFA